MGIINKSKDITDLLELGYNDVTATAVNAAFGEFNAESEHSNLETYASGELKFTLSGSRQYYICTGVDNFIGGHIGIPDTHLNLEVRAIGAGAFEGEPVTSITLPAGLKTIEASAFKGSSLASISIPGPVQSIAQSAFENCQNLQSVVFESGSALTGIAMSAFKGCTALASVTTEGAVGVMSFSNTLTSVGSYAFENCSSLARVWFPTSVTNVGDAVFRNSGITNVYFGGAPSIGAYACQGCASLTEVFLGEASMIGTEAFRDCVNLTQIEVPASVKAISPRAFEGCIRLEQLNFYDNNSFGWYYSSTGVIEAAQIIEGVNCTFIPKPSPKLLTENFVDQTWFKIDKIPAPTIRVEDNILYVTDNSGLAESFNIYIGGECKGQITVQEPYIIGAGTYIGSGTMYLPEDGMYELNFQSRASLISPSLISYKAMLVENSTLYYVFESEEDGHDIRREAYSYSQGWRHEGYMSIVVENNTSVSKAFGDWFRGNYRLE